MTLLRRFIYSIWYFSKPPWDSGVSPPELLAFLNNCPSGRAIDLGCGTGTNIVTLARLGWQVTGVDFTPRAIKQARHKLKLAGVSADLCVGDVTHLDGVKGSYEFALDLGCYHGLSEREKLAYLNQLDQILVPGGTWFLYGFTRETDGDSLPSITNEDQERILKGFKLISRIDGRDRGRKPSAYFIFTKKNINGD